MSKKANFSLDVKALAIELAPLLIPLLTQHIADSLKSLFSEQHEQLLSEMDQLIAATTSLSQAISTTVSAGPGSPMTSSALYSTVARVIHTDAAALVDKAKRCVFIGVPHETSKEATAKTDFLMVAEAVHASDNPDLINALDSGMISTHRHPNYDVSSGRTRPLKRRNVFAALAMKFRNTAYPLKGVEQHPSTKKRGASWKSSKSKKSKQATRNAQNGMADGAAKAVEGPLFLSEKSFKSNKEDRAEPQFNSDKKAYHEDRVKEEPFKSINKANQQANTGKTSQGDDDDYDEGDDTLQGVKSLKQDLDIPSTQD